MIIIILLLHIGTMKPPLRRAGKDAVSKHPYDVLNTFINHIASDDHFSTGRLMSGSGGFRKRGPPNAVGEFAWVLGRL